MKRFYLNCLQICDVGIRVEAETREEAGRKAVGLLFDDIEKTVVGAVVVKCVEVDNDD